MFYKKKGVLEIFAKFTGNNCARVFFNKVRNTSFTEHLWTTASVDFHIKGLPVKHVDYCSLVELATDKIPI